MADALTPDTTPAGMTYTAPPSFATRRTDIGTAYQKAAATLAAQQTGIQEKYGYTPDGKGLDVNAQYGLVQQDDEAEGQALMANDNTQEARGFGGGADSGLGAQRTKLLQYQAGLAGMNRANARTAESDTNLAAQAAAGAQQNTDLYGVDQDEAQWNSGQNALADAQAAWNKANPPAVDTTPTPGQQTPTGQTGAGAVVGAKPVTVAAIAQNPYAGQTARNTGQTGYVAPVAKNAAAIAAAKQSTRGLAGHA